MPTSASGALSRSVSTGPSSPFKREKRKSKSLATLLAEKAIYQEANSKYKPKVEIDVGRQSPVCLQTEFDSLPPDQQWWRLEARRLLENIRSLNGSRLELDNERNKSESVVRSLKEACEKTEAERLALVGEVHATAQLAVCSQAQVCKLRPHSEAAQAELKEKRAEVQRQNAAVEGLRRRLRMTQDDINSHRKRCGLSLERGRKETASSIRIQAGYRGKIARRFVSQMILQRKKQAEQQSAATNIQRAYRLSVGRSQNTIMKDEQNGPAKLQNDKMEREMAAVKIQSAHRGRMGRQKAQRNRWQKKRLQDPKSEKAALDIQRVQRGNTERKKVKRLRAEKNPGKAPTKAKPAEKNQGKATTKAKPGLGVKSCACGANLAADAIFCSTCGKRRPVTDECPCGYVFLLGEAFCKKCGSKKMTGASAASEAAWRDEAEAAWRDEAATKVQSAYRGSADRRLVKQKTEAARLVAIETCLCGSDFTNTDTFCSSCGQKREELETCVCGNILLRDSVSCRQCGKTRSAEVCLSFSMENIEYERLCVNKSQEGLSLLCRVSMKLKELIAKEAAAEILPGQVQLELSAGSLLVQAKIKVPNRLAANSMKSIFLNSITNRAFSQSLIASVQNISGIASATIGLITVKKLKVSVSEAMVEPTSSICKYNGEQDRIRAHRSSVLKKGRQLSHSGLSKNIRKVQAVSKVLTLAARIRGSTSSDPGPSNEPSLSEDLTSAPANQGTSTSSAQQVRMKAQQQLLKANQDGGLAKSLKKRNWQKTMGGPEDDLRSRASMSLFKGVQDGQVQEFVTSIRDLRDRARSALTKGVLDGEQRGSTKAQSSRTQQLRLEAKEGLRKANESGRLAEGFARLQEEKENQLRIQGLRRRLKVELSKAAEDGRFQDSVKKHRVSLELQLQRLDEICSDARQGLHLAVGDGRLEQILQKSLHPQLLRVADLRDKAKASLTKSNQNGTLQQSLDERRASRSTCVSRSTLASSRSTERRLTPNGPNRNIDEIIRKKMKAALRRACQDGTLQQYLDLQAGESERIAGLRRQAKLGLANANKNGTLSDSLTKLRAPNGDSIIAELRARAWNGLIGANSDGRLQEALKEGEKKKESIFTCGERVKSLVIHHFPSPLYIGDLGTVLVPSTLSGIVWVRFDGDPPVERGLYPRSLRQIEAATATSTAAPLEPKVKEELQNNLDFLEGEYLESVMDFLEANNCAGEDEELDLDLDSMAPDLQHQLLKAVDEALAAQRMTKPTINVVRVTAQPWTNPQSGLTTRAQQTMELFKWVDSSGNGFLQASEMFKFAETLGYPDPEAQFNEEYEDVCVSVSCDPILGLDYKLFDQLIQDPDSQYHMEDKELTSFLESFVNVEGSPSEEEEEVPRLQNLTSFLDEPKEPKELSALKIQAVQGGKQGLEEAAVEATEKAAEPGTDKKLESLEERMAKARASQDKGNAGAQASVSKAKVSAGKPSEPKAAPRK